MRDKMSWRLIVALGALLCASTLRANDLPESVEGFLRGPGRLILVPVSLPCGAGMFVVDTGASLTVLDRSFRPYFIKSDPSESESGANAPKGIPTIEGSIPLQLGGISIELRRIALLDLEFVRSGDDSAIIGILGMDLLSHVVLSIDHDKGTFSISKRDLNKTLDRETAISLVDGGRPFVVAHCDKTAEAFMIDTGSMGGVRVKSELFEALSSRQVNTWYMPERYANKAGTHYGLWYCQIDSFGVGGLNANSIVIERAPTSESSNLLGQAFLCRFNMCIDFPNKKFRFAPSKHFSAKDCSDRNGLVLTPSRTEVGGNPAFAITFIRAGSSAHASSLQPNDRIVRVGFQDGTAYQGLGIHSLLAMPRIGPMRVIVERNKREIECELR